MFADFSGPDPIYPPRNQRGANVVMLCRSEDRAAEAVDWIKESSKDSGGGSISFEKCNLGSVESVKKCAEKLNESLDKVSSYGNVFRLHYIPKVHILLF